MNKAIISKCKKYRYQLHRTWDEDLKKVLFIMLNPSTANHIQNDLTTIRCINFAEKWGYGGIMIGNIYPFRAKRPKDLRKWKSTKNDHTILDAYEDNKDKAYQLVRVIKEDTLKNPDTRVLKEWFRCDTLLRAEGKFYFCRLIKDIEYEDLL